ncbi:MAG TPA: efflux RND transporter permease subunit, partial [Verrucomicrobiae bacterium]|nr:efflux RND transporter permease subunit [Verrucomicrobiae bacterium]
VDYAKVLQQRGASRFDAVVEAGRTRLRPIVMTTLAMIFGMLPLFFAIGSGAEMRAPMARGVVGGLLTSSLLTLLVVPVMYTYMDDLDAWLRRKWKGRKGHAALAVALVFLAAGTSHAQPRLLTLEQALEVAGERNADILKAKENRRRLEGMYVEERAAALPQLSADGWLRYERDASSPFPVVTGPEEQPRVESRAFSQRRLTGELTLSQPLFTWGKVGAAIRAAREGLKTADDQLRLFRQAARREVITAFNDLLLAKEVSLLAQRNYAQKEKRLEEARRRHEAGMATDYDVLAARVAAENARPEVIRSANGVRLAADRLRFVLGVQEEVDAAGSLEAAREECSPYGDALAAAVRNRPELAELRHRQGVAEELVKIARAGNKPRLDLKAGYGWRDLDTSGVRTDGVAWNAGVQLSWPLFDGMRTAGRVAQAASELATLRLEERRLLDEIALEISRALNGVREAEEIVGALSGTVEQAERLAAMASQGLEYGVKIRLEVEDAELNLLQARTALARAKRDYLVACAALRWATGRLGEER